MRLTLFSASLGEPSGAAAPSRGAAPTLQGAWPLAPACAPERRRHSHHRESACCGTHCEYLTMRGSRAQGAEGPRLVLGLLKGNLGRLKSGVWGIGQESKGIQQPRGWDKGEGKLRVQTWGTEKKRFRGPVEKPKNCTKSTLESRSKRQGPEGDRGSRDWLAEQRAAVARCKGNRRLPTPLDPGLDRLQRLEVGVRIVAHAFLPSCSAVGIGAVLRESLLGQMAAASYRAQAASQRDTTGRSVVGRLDLERSRSGATSEWDRMSAARGA